VPIARRGFVYDLPMTLCAIIRTMLERLTVIKLETSNDNIILLSHYPGIGEYATEVGYDNTKVVVLARGTRA